MRTIAESAVGRQAENLSKIMPHLFFLKIKCAKSLNAGGIDNGTIGGLRKEIHLGKSGGMHALVVGIRDDAGAGDLSSEKGIEQRGFSYTGIST